MATIRVCDWLKERLAKEEKDFEITIDGKTFEVGEKALKMLVDQLEGDDPPGVPARLPVNPQQPTMQEVAESPAPQMPPGPSVASQLLNVETNEEPFEKGQEGISAPPQQAQAGINEEDRIVIPDDTKKRLPTPSPAQQDRVIQESIVFEGGTLASLNPGKVRSQAVKKMAQRSSKEEINYMNEGGRGINIGRAHQDDPRFYDDD